LYIETNKARAEIKEKWSKLLDKAYLGEDKEILALITQ
jgi:hypothetical protein